MLKIKDDVSLKELEKYGFEKHEVNVGGNGDSEYETVYIAKSHNSYITIRDKDKKIIIKTSTLSYAEVSLGVGYLFELILAGLVEEVEDETETK